jgi:hypothetical protein
MSAFATNIHPFVNAELASAFLAEQQGDFQLAFTHLERAHILGQLSTREHVRVHGRMLLWAIKQRRFGEVLGQITRIIGAASMTALGWVPSGNTGGANISPFTRLPIAPELAAIIASARGGR